MSDKGAEVITDDMEGPDFSEPSYDAGDEQQVNKRKRTAGRIRKEKESFLASVLAQKGGRAWLWEILEFTGTMRTSFSQDPHETSFKEGQRNVGLKIMADIMKAAPEQYAVMTEEAKSNA